MLMIQADTVSGVYEVADSFEKGVSVFSVEDFIDSLPRVLDGETIACVLIDSADIERVEAEYGIKRIKA